MVNVDEVRVGLYYDYRGMEYAVIGLPQVKDASDGNWYDGVLYVRRNAPAGGDFTNHYCRRLDDFAAKFTQVQ